jgi:hypothetical protein
MNKTFSVRHQGVPAVAIPVLVKQLEGYGARVVFEADLTGVLHHPSGKMRFTHAGDVLSIEIIEDAGHFPPAMIIGGIRQAIEEAVEFICGGRPQYPDVQPAGCVAKEGVS